MFSTTCPYGHCFNTQDSETLFLSTPTSHISIVFPFGRLRDQFAAQIADWLSSNRLDFSTHPSPPGEVVFGMEIFSFALLLFQAHEAVMVVAEHDVNKVVSGTAEELGISFNYLGGDDTADGDDVDAADDDDGDESVAGDAVADVGVADHNVAVEL